MLTSNPAKDVRGPEAGSEREGAILYSDELLLLLSGRSVVAGRPDVPLNRRQAYAAAVYTKGRASELEALLTTDVDLAHGTITISKQADRTTKATESAPDRMGTRKTKTKSVRRTWSPTSGRSSSTWWSTGEGGRILHMPPPEDRAGLLPATSRRSGS